jgi:tetratricopeptide (TPR) repeat protein
MTQNYGGTFAQKLCDQGKFDEAVAEATRAIERDNEDPEPLVDRASALASLGRHAEAADDLEAALVLDEEEQMLETDFVDDALFSALLGEARAMTDIGEAVTRLEHYRAVLPTGKHAGDVDVWARRLRGEGRDEVIVKEYEGS